MPPKSSPVLGLFSEPTQKWFEKTHGNPTEIQKLVWPLIAQGKNALATAPTGSGKTLAAFLWAIDCLQTGKWQTGGVRVLYISPLKALNNDIHRNLLLPLEELEASITVGTRSGDTSPAERQRQRKHPPDIFITTPESLNVLLTSKGGRSLFVDLKLVIVDEVHAVASSKRGTHLMTAIERLIPLSGEFQRLALSATVNPLDKIASWFAGHRVVQQAPLLLEPRPVAIVSANNQKQYDLRVVGIPHPSPESHSPNDKAAGSSDAPAEGDSVWRDLARLALERIEVNRSTLIFASGRRTVEKATRFINTEAQAATDIAYAHHGSLSKEVRSLVEERLKAGKLRAIVATSSLELGIDIGSLDEVIQIQSPQSIASLVQRMGRAGHGVGDTSRALLVPLFERDVLGAMVIAKAALDGELEPSPPLRGGLDVLSQVILSMTATETWQIDALFAVIRSCDAYKDLSRAQFEEVLEMLAGCYDNARLRSLEARVLWDKSDDTLTGKRGMDRLVYGSGGTIADRGYFQLRLAENKALLGELDEEFVWERSVGDSFTHGTRAWRIEQIGHNDVFVRPAKGGALIPFWRAEERDRSFFLTEKIGLFLEEAEKLLASGRSSDLEKKILEEYPVNEEAARDVMLLLTRQRASTKASLPHRRHLLVEHFRDPHNNLERRQVVLHTFWGGEINRPFAMALASAWLLERGQPLEVMHTDDCVVVALQDQWTIEDVLRPVRSDTLVSLLRHQLGKSGLFGARFRENAGCALLLPRGDFRRRLPLWLNRMRSKKLLAAVSAYESFPITLETWRTCLQESFDLPGLQKLLDELHDGDIELTETYTDSPSSFSKEVVWKHTNEEMYNDDSNERTQGILPGEDWLRDVTLSSSLRPKIAPALGEELTRKLQRIELGYAPRDADELLNWLKERVAIPETEWLKLLDACQRDRREEKGNPCLTKAWLSPDFQKKTQWIELSTCRLLIAKETLERLPQLCRWTSDKEVPDEELSQIFREWLRFYGPTPLRVHANTWGLSSEELLRILAPLNSADEIVIGLLLADTAEEEVAESQNLETLLRWTRSRGREQIETRKIESLGLFWAQYQGVIHDGVSTAEQLGNVLTQLSGLGAPAGAWEEEIFPARLRPYHAAWLDGLFNEGALYWYGRGKGNLSFVVPEELPLLRTQRVSPELNAALPTILQTEGGGRHQVGELALAGHQASSDVADALFQGAWAGFVSNDGYLAVRQGVLRKFSKEQEPAPSISVRGRRRMGKPRRRPYAGAWFRLPSPVSEEQLDSLDRIEREKDRARLLLDRYGVVFREVVTREAEHFEWRDIFRALRLMELSGEVASGHYFSGIQGLQFISSAAQKTLRKGLPDDAIYWVSGLDPACANGLGLGGAGPELPHRKKGSHLVFRGCALVIVSTKSGRNLEINLALETVDLDEYFLFFKNALTRGFSPRGSIEIEEINGERASTSPWRLKLAELFDLSGGPRSITLRRRYEEV